MARDQVFTCVRIKDMPTPAVESAIRECANCKFEVWVSKNSVTFAEEECSEILCLACVLAKIESKEDSK